MAVIFLSTNIIATWNKSINLILASIFKTVNNLLQLGYLHYLRIRPIRYIVFDHFQRLV